jgi:hypothetical protein
MLLKIFQDFALASAVTTVKYDRKMFYSIVNLQRLITSLGSNNRTNNIKKHLRQQIDLTA